MNIFLDYNWLVKHNPEVNWKNKTIKFIRCPRSYKMEYQNIKFKNRRTQTIETTVQDNSEIKKELNKTNLEDLPKYIQSFTYLFNKKKFEKLLERCE